MLHLETIKPGTFSLLKELMNVGFLDQFQLVGGTALALQLGHRISDDIDLFSNKPFDNEDIINALANTFKDRFLLTSGVFNKLGVFALIDDIKLDICRHKENLIDEIIVNDRIRMWGTKDIAASKVNAISRRAKKKDFWDIDELLDIYSIDEIAAFYRAKYLPMLAIGVAQMITYYDEAEDSEPPVCLKGKTWQSVKKSIFRKINQQLK